MNIVSFGGGTNSTAMIIGMWQRKIPIDLIVFADTGGEKPETYAFVEMFSSWLEDHNQPKITIVQRKYMGLPYTLEQERLQRRALPGVVYGKAECSVNFKIKPQELFCNNNDMCRVVWGRGEKVNKFVGYDAGEQRRISKNQGIYEADKKYTHNFPLLEWGWNREGCVAAIEAVGLQRPGKSSCFFCPNAKKAEIQWLWEHHPDLFDRAVALERNARKTQKDGTPFATVGLGRDWTWEEYRRVNLERQAAKADQIVFPGFEEQTGGCCCGMPCGCYDG